MNTVAITDTFLPTRFPKRFRSARVHLEFDSGPPKMTPEEFWLFCQENHKINAELTKNGEVIIMPPTGYVTGSRNAEITAQLRIWGKKNKLGVTTDSNTGFILPNGATYAPDAAWVSNKRLKKFTKAQLEQFLPLCPDFVVELASASDTLTQLKTKMAEYIENGAKLGWLIDPKKKKVYVYRADGSIEVFDDPKTISGQEILKDFELDLTEVW